MMLQIVIGLIVVESSATLAGNVFGLGEGGDFHHKCSYEARMFKFMKNCHTKH